MNTLYFRGIMRKVLAFLVIALIVVYIAFMYLTTSAMENQKVLRAFPSAEGSGMFTVGGRGGKVIEVTNLNDKGIGSLREACEARGSRTVVFKVSGIIDLKGKRIIIREDNITIAGQSAPADGIQIKNGGLIVNANEVIIRYLRIRPGAAYPSVDALTIASPNRYNRKKNIIVDHLSLYWGVDEVCDSGSFNDNVTIQWSIIAEGLHCSVYDNNGVNESWKHCNNINNRKRWAHSRGIMITEDSRNISLHHNLFFNNYKRNPLIQSSDVDMVNNVVVNYQYQVYVQPFKAKVQANFVGNYFRSAIHKRPPIRVFDYNKGYDGNSSIYYSDNYDSVFRKDTNQSETDIRIQHMIKSGYDSDGHVQDKKTRHPFIEVTTHPVHQAYELVLKKVGTIYPVRDSVDNRVINFVKDGKVPKNFVDFPKDVGGWSVLKTIHLVNDFDHDGMPDLWEEKWGLNPKDERDRNGLELSNQGYTNLEVYLNSLVK